VPIQIDCPACRRSLRVPDELIGQLVKCPSCLSEFTGTEGTRAPQLDPSYRPAEHVPPPVRLPAPPAPIEDNDDWNDDFELRRRGIDRDRARSEVFWPAVGLMTTAVIGLLVGALVLIFGIVEVDDAQTPDEKIHALRSLIQGPIAIASSIVILFGGYSMMQLKNHGLATTSAVLALVPCTSPCCVIGLPIGVWSMVVLTKMEIKRAFR
jgi:hypothetical protein